MQDRPRPVLCVRASGEWSVGLVPGLWPRGSCQAHEAVVQCWKEGLSGRMWPSMPGCLRGPLGTDLSEWSMVNYDMQCGCEDLKNWWLMIMNDLSNPIWNNKTFCIWCNKTNMIGLSDLILIWNKSCTAELPSFKCHCVVSILLFWPLHETFRRCFILFIQTIQVSRTANWRFTAN